MCFRSVRAACAMVAVIVAAAAVAAGVSYLVAARCGPDSPAGPTIGGIIQLGGC
jgi:hypothetical protein